MRVVLGAAVAAGFTLLWASAPASGAGGTLTVPARIQLPAGVDASFAYPEPGPICTTGVTFTWDGASWVTELPLRSGADCVARAAGAPPPAGRAGAGPHTVCGAAGARFSDCKTVTVVPGTGGAASASAAPAASADGATAAAGASPAPDTGLGAGAQAAAPPPAPLAFWITARRDLAMVALAAAAAVLAAGAAAAAWLARRSRRPASRSLPRP
jgi:hypothetical protein